MQGIGNRCLDIVLGVQPSDLHSLAVVWKDYFVRLDQGRRAIEVSWQP